MKEIDLSELKIIQMDILEAVDEFCVSNNMKYSMAGGTMIGAVRHKGYIPWDDDIDIYLLREDYERFVSLFPHNYKGCYDLVSLNNCEKWDRPYANIYDNRTQIIENANNAMIIGVNIDVYPLDDVPDDQRKWQKLFKKQNLLYYICIVKTLQWNKNRSIWNNIFLILMKFLFMPMSQRSIASWINNFSQKNNGKGYKRVFEMVQGNGLKAPFLKADFYDISRYQFEDKMFMGFTDYDDFLRNSFGNYMELPPEEKRISTHGFKAYWL